MSIEKCLMDKVKEGKLSDALAKEALRNVKRLEAKYRRSMSPAMAESAAAAETARVMTEVAERRKLQRGLKIVAMDRALAEIENHSKGESAGLMAVLTRDIFEESEFLPAETLAEIIRGQLAREFDIGLSAYRSTLAGLQQDKIGIRNMVRELYGIDTGDAVAKNAADAWRRTTDLAAKRYAAAGGEIVERDDWRLNQSHDAELLRRAGFNQWSRDVRDAFDRGELDIFDFATGERASDEQLAELLRDAYRHIVSRVEHSRTGAMTGDRALPRMFHWKTADGWLAYNDQYGSGQGGIFNLVTGHLERMSRDIALTESLGPGHRSSMESLVKHVTEAESATPSRSLKRASPTRWFNNPVLAMHSYRYMNGELSVPVGEMAAGFMSGIRGWLTSAQLGSATLTAVPGDSVTSLVASANLGIPSVRVIDRAARLMAGNSADKKLAVQQAIVAHAISDTALGTKRFGDELFGQNFGGRLADTVIRASGLAHWTQSLKMAFMMEFTGLMARQSGRSFKSLDSGVKRAFKRYGITEAEWDAIRSADALEGPDGVRFWTPTTMEDQGLAEKVMSMIIQERAHAVIEPDARVRGFLLQGTRRGSAGGELLRSTAMYKSFSVTILLTSLTRAMFRTPERGGLGGIGTRLAALAGLQLMLTFAGAMAIQMRELSKGKDPRPMDNVGFWAASNITGGGSGFLGDFATSGYARGDRGIVTAVAGPVAGLAEDVARITLPNVRQAIEGRDTNIGSEISRAVRYYTPGSNLWYFRAALDRMAWDQLRVLMDPDYADAFRRQERRSNRDFGNDYYWPPGVALPERAPNLETALDR